MSTGGWSSASRANAPLRGAAGSTKRPASPAAEAPRGARARRAQCRSHRPRRDRAPSGASLARRPAPPAGSPYHIAGVREATVFLQVVGADERSRLAGVGDEVLQSLALAVGDDAHSHAAAALLDVTGRLLDGADDDLLVEHAAVDGAARHLRSRRRAAAPAASSRPTSPTPAPRSRRQQARWRCPPHGSRWPRVSCTRRGRRRPRPPRGPALRRSRDPFQHGPCAASPRAGRGGRRRHSA